MARFSRDDAIFRVSWNARVGVFRRVDERIGYIIRGIMEFGQVSKRRVSWKFHCDVVGLLLRKTENLFVFLCLLFSINSPN